MSDKLMLRNFLSGALSVFRFRKISIAKVKQRELEEYFIRAGDDLKNVFFSDRLAAGRKGITAAGNNKGNKAPSNQKNITS